MKIYTKKGDAGKTSLYGGALVSKHHKRIMALGLIDELNAFLGFALAVHKKNDGKLKITSIIETIQSDLIIIGAHLSTTYSVDNLPDHLPELSLKQIEQLEQWIDQYEKELPKLKNFILPGGVPGGAALHIARAVCRRAERVVVELNNEEGVELLPALLTYLNRLSDLLFMLARAVNFANHAEEKIWKK
ncbi:MAG: ATP:cob(I)alamin adenosyltransferase [Candidatus Kerfeldbacteria bacterium RIFOXYA2_FULL_38_24]|uniref:Corrinoid adenosyltransferase n=1 Tax=Candidatus Kerfeldbacteria bacterium RIFOXYB2_FULL_38_14 TaxID=1798547 RepID=A0A1G2BFU2_9BACT|nr:MAG: ATP:cob(I)alamin adenosyltransferase [Candidatus Kerfeldbacteria bacterium RIFOXYA2_FULL_38_24]OGY88098.1 MAG: ATP:cob(I)alamin adenosyltransferase [Candidatus Kerfeldbacteria bacterium RIFOXYB2_FULL_38_14]OGY88455.1 MAG: ATP:cob(I)alamin adenosyltransferase [Candidatus Kerfeldbacteria bacterium RIFOXYC2_FULL_38_9]